MGNENAQQPAATLTMEAVQKLIQDQISAALSPLNESIGKLSGAISQQTKTASVRNRFIDEKMKGVPQVYLRDLPETDDLHVLLEAEQKIRKVFQEDLKMLGFKAPDVSGNVGGGTGTSGLITMGGTGQAGIARQVGGTDRKPTPTELVSQGLAKLPPPVKVQ